MVHPFQDKLFVIISKSDKHSRQAIRDALTVVGAPYIEEQREIEHFSKCRLQNSEVKKWVGV